MKHIVRGCSLAFAAALLAIGGCTDEEPQEATAPVADAPSVYMNDPAYAAAKAKVMRERSTLVNAREQVIAQMETMWKAAQAKLPAGADAAAIEAELATNPEWISLRKRLDDAQGEYTKNIEEAQRIVGERIAPKKQISK